MMPSVGYNVVKAIPPAGSPGQLLTKNTAVDYDTGWSSASTAVYQDLPGPWLYPATGRWFEGHTPPGTGATYNPGLNPNSCWYVPFFTQTPLPVDRVQINVTTPASGSANIGFTGVTASGQPGALL